ncbi:DUF2189 domain-containing protein [Rhodovulum sp. DZ06]|uniref:DUF2189 domain-containing protein n=1 Tax=Rhodovulum sp. DZ06 TaxID=3425126 RepID=UPI003D32F76D
MTDAAKPAQPALSPSEAALPPMPKIRRIEAADIKDALRLGWEDFRAATGFGLFFGAFYAFAGMILWLMLSEWNMPWLMIPLGVGFPLLGPFIAVGLYEVSRQRQRGEKLRWGHVLGVMVEQRKRELGWMAFVTLFIFWVWLYQIRLLLAIIMGKMSFSSLDQFMGLVFTTAEGWTFLTIGAGVGALLALALFSSTVVSIPLLLDRDRDFITALITSWQSVIQNPRCMIAWGLVVTAAVMAGMATFFLGLIVVLPVLGHATWHLYQKLVEPEEPR